MKPAKLIKIGKNWKCIFDSKKGKSEKPVTDKALVEWLNKVIESPENENDILIQDDTGLKEVKYKELVFPPIHENQKAKDMADHQNQSKKRNGNNFQKPINAEKHARSPYNFVPLNTTNAKLLKGNVTFDRYIETTNSGYIEVEITNLTPLFIRQVSSNVDSFKYGNDNFGIPGSSFRGMIRQMSEILSFGNFGSFLEKRLYFRSIFHKDSQNAEYKNEIGFKTTNIDGLTYSDSGSIAGYLDQEKKIIYPCVKINGKTYERKLLRSTLREDAPIQIINKNSDGTHLIQTGSSTKKNSQYLVYQKENNKKLQINDEVFENFKNDSNRGSNVNTYLKANKVVPIFYILDENSNLKHMGHTPFYRIPYSKTIGEHIVNRKSQSINNSDLVQNLFGDSFSHVKEGGMIASRISFGDLMSDNAEILNNKSYLLKILASPKPTTFQHYLEQGKNSNIASNSWNSDANIRGFKMYWHRGTKNDGSFDLSWNEPWDKKMDNEINPKTRKEFKTDSHTIRIKPIKPNATFKGKIWFQNLNDLELGLLLMALEPNCSVSENEKIAHKIGLAKPLGLGSIKIKVEALKVFDMTKEGYFSSFAPVKPMKDLEVKDIKNIFNTECAQALGLGDGGIWETERLKELKAMMIWDDSIVSKDDWLQKTRYMEIERHDKQGQDKNEFKTRPILPKPSEVKNKPNSDFI